MIKWSLVKKFYLLFNFLQDPNVTTTKKVKVYFQFLLYFGKTLESITVKDQSFNWNSWY